MSSLPVLFLLAALAAPPPPPVPPAPPVAAPMPPQPPEPPEEGVLRGDWPKEQSGRTVSLTDNQTIDDAVEEIGQKAGWNVVTNTGAIGDRRLVVRMKHVPVEEALEAVLTGSGLAATRKGDTVTISPMHSAPRTQIRPTLTGFDKPSGKKVDADFKDTPADAALRQLAEKGGFSISVPSWAKTPINAHFQQAPVEDALKVVLEESGLAAEKNGSIIRVTAARGPRVVISGHNRHFSFSVGDDEDAEDPVANLQDQIDRATQDAEQAAEDAAQAAEDAASQTGRGLHRRNRGRDKSVTGGDVTLGSGEKARDVVAVRGSVKLENGAQAREAAAIFGNVDLAPGAVVDRDAVAVGGDIHVSPGARIGRAATSVGGKIIIDPGGQIDGEQTSVAFPGLKGALLLVGGLFGLGAAASPLMVIGNVLAQFAMFFALGLMLLLFAPRRIESVAQNLLNAPAKAATTGILGFLALPLLGFLLAITVIGIPLILVEFMTVMVAAVFGYSALALIVGRLIPVKITRGAAVAQLAMGTAIIVVLSEIPIVGTLAWLCAGVWAFGAVIRTKFGGNGAQPASPPTDLPMPAPGAT